MPHPTGYSPFRATGTSGCDRHATFYRALSFCATGAASTSRKQTLGYETSKANIYLDNKPHLHKEIAIHPPNIEQTIW